jgi:DNA repair protein RadC
MAAQASQVPWPPEIVEVRERAQMFGAETLATPECLALVLRSAAGRAAPGWAACLLQAFGSLPQLLGAPLPDLLRRAPPRVALDLALLHDLQRRTLAEALHLRPVLSSVSAVHDYLRIVMAAEPREQFRVLFLDRRLGLIRDEVMGRGTVNHAPVYPREVVRRALELNASGVLIAHNHPSGDTSPSSADVDMTRQVEAACRALRLSLHDHLLVAGDQVVSFRSRGLL